MKALLLTSALAAGLALPATAQTATGTSPFQTEAAGPSVSASDLIGARVYASEAAVEGDAVSGPQEGWNDLGEVNDIILGRDGSVDAVLVDIGGFLGVGERQVAVDMAALRFVQDDATDADDWFLVMQANRATLDAAPEWSVVPPAADTTGTDATTGETMDQSMNDSTGATGGTTVDTTDGTDGTTTTGEAAAPATDPTAPEDDLAAAPGTPLTVDPATDDTAADSTADPATDPATGTTSDTDTATAPAAGDMPALPLPEGYAEVTPDVLTADMLDGADVHDMSGASIAEVSDLVLSSDGTATDVIVDVGGFLGIGARQVAIPMDRVTVAQNGEGSVRVYVDMSKDELTALPEVQI